MNPEEKEMETPNQNSEGEPSEKPTGEEETPESSQEEKPDEEKSKELQSALAQKEHWRKKNEEAEKKLQELQQEKPSESAPKEVGDEWKAKVEFILQNRDKNYSEEEFDHISNVSSRKGISIDEAAKQEDDYIQFKREKVAKEKKTPSPSSPGSESFSKSPQEIGKMSREEHKEYEENFRKRKGGGGI